MKFDGKILERLIWQDLDDDRYEVVSDQLICVTDYPDPLGVHLLIFEFKGKYYSVHYCIDGDTTPMFPDVVECKEVKKETVWTEVTTGF